MTNTELFRMEIIGVVAITIVGSLLHFCYEWSNSWSVAGIFCAVNESVWEHMKIGFWPGLLYSGVLWYYLNEPPENFWFAETMGLYSLTLLIPILFYSYTAILGRHILVLDILIFVIAVIVGRLVSYWILVEKLQEPWKGLTMLLLIGIVFAFSTFTYYPPKLPLFKDPSGGGYGL